MKITFYICDVCNKKIEKQYQVFNIEYETNLYSSTSTLHKEMNLCFSCCESIGYVIEKEIEKLRKKQE